jgi:hypothetical protein
MKLFSSKLSDFFDFCVSNKLFYIKYIKFILKKLRSGGQVASGAKRSKPLSSKRL